MFRNQHVVLHNFSLIFKPSSYLLISCENLIKPEFMFRNLLYWINLMLSILQITCIQQEHDRKELSLKADHSEELKRVQLQAEDDLREVYIAILSLGLNCQPLVPSGLLPLLMVYKMSRKQFYSEMSMKFRLKS